MGGAYESFYGGGGSSLNPKDGNPFVGYRLNPIQLGFSTNPTQGPDQLKEAMRGIRAGSRVIEVNLLNIQGDHDEQIPKHHFREMRALMKLTGVKPSVHGPLVDAAGIERGSYSKENRMDHENRMFHAMEKAKMIDTDKNIPVIFHSSHELGGGTTFKPGDVKKGEERFKEEFVPIINHLTKQVEITKEQKTYYLGEGETYKEGGRLMKIDDAIRSRNATMWDDQIKNVTLEKRYVDQALKEVLENTASDVIRAPDGRIRGTEEGEIGLRAFNILNADFKKDKEEIEKRYPDVFRKINNAEILLHNNHTSFNQLFNQAYKYGSDEQKKELRKLNDQYEEENEELEKDPNLLRNPVLQLKLNSQIQDKFLHGMKNITDRYGAPKINQRAEEFAMGEASKTFGNVGAKSFKELGGMDAPVVSIENVWNGAYFARGKAMKELVEKSRKKMVEQLTDKEFMGGKVLNEREAKKAAEKLIGMNFDVGHINMFKKKGFTDKDLVGEVKQFIPLINHMHLTDNFGGGDEHLVPGQGNVPFKAYFEEIAKTRDLNTFKKIVETGGVESRHLGGQTAHAMNLAAFGVMTGSATYGGTFDRAMNTFGGYSTGYGNVNPEIHHSVYFGGGFSGMPSELGGTVPGIAGQRSRMGGAPLA